MEASNQLHTVADLRTREALQYPLNMDNRTATFPCTKVNLGLFVVYLVTKYLKLLIYYQIICHPHAYLKSLIIFGLPSRMPDVDPRTEFTL